MPLKRTYSTTTSIVPAGKKPRTMRKARIAWPINGTVGKPKPFPTRMQARLRYCETVSVTQSVNVAGNFCYIANGIYDPNSSGAGHQPYGHDTYSSIYNQYTVLSSKIKVTPTRFNSASNVITWGIGIEDAPSSGAAADTWAERPEYSVIASCRGDGATGGKPLTKSWNRMKRFPHADTYRALSAVFGSNPSETETFNIIVQSADVITALGTVYFFVELEYICEFYELKDLGSS